MRGFDRFLLFVYSLAFMIVSLFALLIGIGFFNYDLLYKVSDTLYSNQDVKMTILGISVITAIMSIYFLVKSMKSREVHTFSETHSEIGEIRISTETIENIARKVSAKIKGVLEQKVRVKLEDNETVNVIIKVFVDGERPIPEISEELQLNVKQTIEQIAGISVGNVHIVVGNVGQTNQKKKRVE